MIVKKTLIITLLYILSINGGHAFDIDETVNDDIRKNYNPSLLINDTGIKESALEKNITSTTELEAIDSNLPELPQITKPQSQKNLKTQTQASVASVKFKPYQGGNIKVKSGTAFDVKNTATISDWQRKGTKVKFTLKNNTFGKDYSIPAGTIFNGEIIESHQPQITCNGGLIVIKVDSMQYKEQIVPITAYVTRANDKKIFFNNIKGKRTYMKTTWKKGNWGRNLFNNMLTVTANLGSESSTLILSPFPFAYGTLCLGINAITSPICAFFSKGDHISIPAGSDFRIKLIDEVFIN